MFAAKNAAGSETPPAIYAEAPLMKNHLSMLLSIFSAGTSWWAGIAGSWSGVMRLGEWATVKLALEISMLVKW